MEILCCVANGGAILASQQQMYRSRSRFCMSQIACSDSGSVEKLKVF